MIGIIGASGAVGRHAAALLAGHPLRLGSRSAGERVDAHDPDSVARFAEGCRVVLNCAGPSYSIVDKAARGALSAGAAYVDVSGDEPAAAVLSTVDHSACVVLSAGMLPGLTGVLPRLLADGPAHCVEWYAGGVAPTSAAAAADLVLSMASGTGYGLSGALWRDGAVVAGALTVREDTEVAFFPGRVTAQPFLPEEAVRAATAVGAARAVWWNVFVGDGLRSALGSLRGRDTDLAEAVRRVRRGADLDAAGREPFHLLVCSVDDRTIVLRTTDSYRLTAAVAAHTVSAVLAGTVAPGTHYAADVLDPPALLDAVRRDGALTHADVFDGVGADLVEEGAL